MPRYLQYCSCECGLNQTVIPLLDGDNNRLPCSSCTRQFCLNSDACNVAVELVLTKCFQRESIKDQVVVWAFIILTVILIALAAFKRQS